MVEVELGPNLAAVARRNLAAFPDVEVVEAPFEAWPLPASADVPTVQGELEAGGRFAVAGIRRYERDIAYTAAAYLDVLCTYSSHRALEPARREALLDCIAALIDGHGGRIAKR